MQEKIIALLLSIALVLSMSACSNNATSQDTDDVTSVQPDATATEPTDSVSEESESEHSAAEKIIEQIESDFNTTTTELQSSSEAVIDAIGGTYDGYVANQQLLLSWYSDSEDQLKNLVAATIENTWSYLELVFADDEDDLDTLDALINAFYDEVGDALIENAYDDICEGIIEDIYDDVCDSVFDDAYTQLDYDEWYSAYSESYDACTSAYTSMYELLYGLQSELIDIIFAAENSFYAGNYDIATIRAEYEAELNGSTDTDDSETTDENTATDESSAIDATTDSPDTDNTSDEDEEPKDTSVSYSTNDKNTVKNGNTGVYSYKSKGGSYDIYWIIDFDEGYVYWFTEGNNNSVCDRLEIDSGDLNDVLIITYHDGDSSWSEGLHFKYKNQPDHLIMQEESGAEYDYYTTNLEDALKLRDSKTIIDY